ncbi:MAG: hypothetical protein JSS43_19420, partial [Proteobacteria bacterium]|nr:hypothetical protein [Pseudomonadota bacterium]
MNAARRAAPILATFLAALLLTLTTFRFIDLRNDMADFLPAAPTEAGRLML